MSLAPLRYPGGAHFTESPCREVCVFMCFVSSVLTHSYDTGAGGGLSRKLWNALCWRQGADIGPPALRRLHGAQSERALV